MSLPDWLPNIHPIIVHMPIAILVTAIVMDLVSLFYRNQALRYASTGLLGLGAIGTVAAYFSGQQAADSVLLPPLANPVLNEHSDLGLMTMLFFMIYAIVRLFAVYRNWLAHKLAILATGVVSLAGLFLLYETGEHGAMLVFKYGVGVEAASGGGTTARSEGTVSAPDSLTVSVSGSWSWDPGKGAVKTLARDIQWFSGSASGAQAFAVADTARGMVLQFNLHDEDLLLAAGGALVSVQVDLLANLDDFDGTLRVIHHLIDAENYDFVGISKGAVELGRLRDGEVQVMDRSAIDYSGWLDLGVVGGGRQFRGYIDKKLVVHGHGSEPPSGLAGIAMAGTGMVLLDQIVVTALK